MKFVLIKKQWFFKLFYTLEDLKWDNPIKFLFFIYSYIKDDSKNKKTQKDT
jgi:hypothetical protein